MISPGLCLRNTINSETDLAGTLGWKCRDGIEESTKGFTGREWVFQAIDDWLADVSGSRSFIISGDPGFICKAWTSDPQKFKISPLQQTPGLNI